MKTPSIPARFLTAVWPWRNGIMAVITALSTMWICILISRMGLPADIETGCLITAFVVGATCVTWFVCGDGRT